MTFKPGNTYGKKPCNKILIERYKKERLGEKNPNWKGGVTLSTCKYCGKLFKHYKSKKRIYCSSVCTKSCPTYLNKKVLSATGKVGNLSSNWQGGKTTGQKERTLRLYDIWRDSVFKRDNYTCRICGKRGHVIQAHHILSFSKYNKLRTDIVNGITVCVNCHKKLHRSKKCRNIGF